MEELRLTLGELRRRHPEIIENARRHIFDHSILIIRIDERKGQSEFLGSGTLVELEHVRGILTAQHLSAGLRSCDTVGFGFRENEHTLRVQADYLESLAIASPRSPAAGPDLAFMLLPPREESTIAGVKSFVNLGRATERLPTLGPEADLGSWCLAGTAGERVVREGPSAHFEEVLGCYGEVGWTGVTRRFEDDGGYDYIDLSVDYRGEDSPPRDFGGYSGGGAWYVPMRLSTEEQIQAAPPVLGGVAFYQSAIENEVRTVRCHGPRSVYVHTTAAIARRYLNR